MSILLRSSQAKRSYPEPAILRDLYTRVLGSSSENDCKVFGITSAMDGEGKTVVVSSLAIVLANDKEVAKSDEQVGDILILDCGEGPTSATEEFMVETTPGLTQYLRGEQALEDVIKPTFLSRLWILPVGDSMHKFSILIRANALDDMMRSLRERFDLIIIDLPSALTTTDTHVLAELADQVVVVACSGVTNSKLLGKALQEFDREKLAGVVLNDSREDLPQWLAQRM